MTLVILAAGMATRFGGCKQLTPLTSEGDFIIDFTVYDAVKVGFDKFVFIIRKETEEAFESTIGARLKKNNISYSYAYQTLDLPEGIPFPEGRVKPFGTANALICASANIKENFGVVNADDFYGRDALKKLYDFLSKTSDDEKSHFCMVGYYLKNTLSENGTVSRGICTVEDGKLVNVIENTKLSRMSDGKVTNQTQDGEVEVSENSVVSMNCWGFTASFLGGLYDLFIKQLKENIDNLQKFEFYIPSAVQNMIDQKQCDVAVVETTSEWHGVTYADDSELFWKFAKSIKESGEYPKYLF